MKMEYVTLRWHYNELVLLRFSVCTRYDLFKILLILHSRSCSGTYPESFQLFLDCYCHFLLYALCDFTTDIKLRIVTDCDQAVFCWRFCSFQAQRQHSVDPQDETVSVKIYCIVLRSLKENIQMILSCAP